MIETEITPTKVFLISVDTGEFNAESSMNELAELASTAGAEVIAKITQKRPSMETGTCVGTGRLQEIAEMCRQLEPDLIIFDHELTATQIRNIENILQVRVIDRTMLILDIFAQRATTKEGRLQVELAQQKYRLPRLAGMGTQLSRLGGGIGTRGPGETKLETDKRHIRARIETLSDELKEIEKRRQLSRSRRKKDEVMIAAIVGYTNAGKSTLLNTMTQAGVLAENKLFATLETTSRSIELPDGRSVMLIDTVGLIRRLPHHLVEAFKSTLEEAAGADVIIHLCDVSDPEADEKSHVTLNLLSELGCKDIPVITVLNKCDLCPEINSIPNDNNTVKICAKTGEGLDELINAITHALPVSAYRMNLLIPYERTEILNKIRKEGKVFTEEYTPEGISADCLVDIKIFPQVKAFKITPQGNN